MKHSHRLGRIGAAMCTVMAGAILAGGVTVARAQAVDSDTFAITGVLHADPPVTAPGEQTGTLTLTDDCVAVSIDSDAGHVDAEANAGCISASGPFTADNCAVVTSVMTGTMTGLPRAGTDTTLDTYDVSFTLTMIGGVGMVDGTASEPGSTSFAPFVGWFVAPTSDDCIDGISDWGFDGAITTTA